MTSVRELLDLDGRTALVTGGAGHIALAAEETLMELGADVAVVDVSARACKDRATRLARRWRRRAWPVPADLATEEGARACVEEALGKSGRLDILIHTAALVGTSVLDGWAVPFERQSVAAWDAALRVNLTSAFVLAQQAQRPLQRSGHGSVILLGSTYGLVAPDFRLYEKTKMQNPAAYGASKGGLLQLTRHLASVLAPKVRVNALCPGGVERGQPMRFRRRYEQRTMLGRMAREDDFKGAVAYLASDASRYVTGHNLVVDGGWTAW